MTRFAGSLGGSRDPLLFFLHIPKAAGTTLKWVLKNEYGEGYVAIGNVFKGAGGVSMHQLDRISKGELGRPGKNPRVISGHLPFSVVQHLPEGTRTFTMLREPLDRTVSHYFFIRDRTDDETQAQRARNRALAEEMQLAEVASSGILFPDNIQTRMLADDPRVGEPSTPAMLEEAKRNLVEKIEVVGLVERFDESLALMWKAFGWRAPLYRSPQRVTAHRPSVADLAPDERAAVLAANSFDVELHRFATELVAGRLAKQDDAFWRDVKALERARARLAGSKGRPTGDGTRPRSEVRAERAIDLRARELQAEFAAALPKEQVRALKERARELEALLQEEVEKNRRLEKTVDELRRRLDGREDAEPVTEAPDVEFDPDESGATLA